MSPTEELEESTTMAEQRPTRNSTHGALRRLYHGETRADIVGRWKLWFALSGTVILIGVVALVSRGLNLGIDFTGGTVWQVQAGDAEVTEVTDAMASLGYEDVQVQEITQNSDGNETRFLRVEAESAAEPAAGTTSALDAVRGDLGRVRTDAPAAEREPFTAVINNLDGVEGPFRTDVPEPLTALQAEVDGLAAALEAAPDENATALVYQAATERMLDQVEELEALEAAELSRLGQDVTTELARLTGTTEEDITVDTVGPSWGQQISEKARNALVVFMIAISIFITIRFELKMAVATIVALFHDLLVVVGLYALFGFPVTPATVIALLTMLGFSIYDGIVVFDRVDENTALVSGAKSRMTYSEMANLSLNQVLMRSLNTSITTLMPIASVLVIGALILGASTLEEYGLALFLGLMSGAYSSLFIATPLLALLKEREPQYREVRAALAAKRQGSRGPVSGAGSIETAAASGPAPRPRKNGKK